MIKHRKHLRTARQRHDAAVFWKQTGRKRARREMKQQEKFWRFENRHPLKRKPRKETPAK